MKTIQVLQLGEKDYSKLMRVADCAQWYYESDFFEPPEKEFDVAILDREITENELDFLVRSLRAYTLFITEGVPLENNSPTRELLMRKKGKRISAEELRTLIEEELPDYFPGSYGEKFNLCDLSVAQGFRGKIAWRGYEGVDLLGDFGDEMTQAVFWRYNIPIEKNQPIDFWLEYAKDDSVEVSLEIRVLYFSYGAAPRSIKTWTFSEKDLEGVVCVENPFGSVGRMYASLRAKGKGRLSVTALHDRYSRRGKGVFLPGGQRRVTSDREEIFYYFDPGNFKPPMNVYFSGYRTREGFEGYNMLRKLGHPFLLIAESRLVGGAFYIGSEEYENILERIILDHMEELGFRRSDVILSGISGGSYGALYYGCRIRPHTILTGKPLASIGDIAGNERLNRPGEFPTSLDMLHKYCGSLDRDSVSRLNDRFWNTFDQVEWDGTQFAAAYMIEDDYDCTAYKKLQSHLIGTNVRIYGKGIHGRHNDNTAGIVSWFVKQYHRVIEDYFSDAQSKAGGQRQ